MTTDAPTCDCTVRAVVHRDEQQHAGWHALVTAQTGLPLTAAVDATTLRDARGMKTEAPDDHKTREKHLRTGKSSPGWRREAAR